MKTFLTGFVPLEWRLNGGTTPNEGRLEVRIQQNDPTVWHTICADSLADHYLPLLCPTLGFPYTPLPCSVRIEPTVELPVTELGEILYMFAICQVDTSRSLSDCDYVDLSDATLLCTHDKDAWIRCLAGKNFVRSF